MEPQEIEAMIERAAQRGARQALESIGLHDDLAGKDVQELRNLLETWRDAKRVAWKTVTQAVTMLFLGALAAGTFFQLRGGK